MNRLVIKAAALVELAGTVAWFGGSGTDVRRIH
jgi:hypothetical protein